jgi:hypothetical protein
MRTVWLYEGHLFDDMGETPGFSSPKFRDVLEAELWLQENQPGCQAREQPVDLNGRPR